MVLTIRPSISDVTTYAGMGRGEEGRTAKDRIREREETEAEKLKSTIKADRCLVPSFNMKKLGNPGNNDDSKRVDLLDTATKPMLHTISTIDSQMGNIRF